MVIKRLPEASERAARPLRFKSETPGPSVRPKFITLNLIVLCLIFAAWRAGFFGFSSAFTPREVVMLVALVLYSTAGFWAAFRGRWQIAAHIANGTPMFALAMTGLGMLLATLDLTELTPQALAQVFREMVLAITPNILGVFLLAWLRELAFWCGNAEI
jgi:hypothetical protein